MNITLSQATAFYLILIIGATFPAHSDTNPEPLLSFTHDELYSPSPALRRKIKMRHQARLFLCRDTTHDKRSHT